MDETPHIDVVNLGGRAYAPAVPRPDVRQIIDSVVQRYGDITAPEAIRGSSEPTAWRVPTPATPPPPGYAALYVTFGQRYVRERHETNLPWPHPDGFLTVHFPDVPERSAPYVGDTYPRSGRERARQTVMAYLGGHFATSYDEVPTEYVPWGQLALMVLP